MKRYTSFKEVDAAIITLVGEENSQTGMVTLHLRGDVEGEIEHFPVSKEWLAKHSDNGSKDLVGGYLVRYADGYTSWSPAAAFEEGYKEITNEGHAALAVEDENADLIKHMTDRFLGWKLPADFMPDGGVTFTKGYNNGTEAGGIHEPVGTNLLTAQQAQEMFAYLLEGFNLKK